MRLKINRPTPAEEIVEVHVILEMSDGRNPKDGFVPGSQGIGGKPPIPEKMGTPQPWVYVHIGDKRAGCPVADLKTTAVALYDAAVAWALGALELTASQVGGQ